jgi:hypothetical protein
LFRGMGGSGNLAVCALLACHDFDLAHHGFVFSLFKQCFLTTSVTRILPLISKGK